MDRLRRELPHTSLFVFFNKVYKILDKPFDRPSLLVARSGSVGANIVYRKEVKEVLGYFPADTFLGVMNVRAHPGELFSEAGKFEGAAVGHLDLSSHFSSFYPGDHIPTSGFALALWLSEYLPEKTIVLDGFSARRSEKWKVFHLHDWTFEQVVLRLFIHSGKLVAPGAAEKNAYAALLQRFPDLTEGAVALSAADVLASRLEGANKEIDKLISVTKILRWFYQLSKKLKPKTRKQRLNAKKAKS
ncbi:3-deoxy-manno-octulosonate cytidylyltransferase [Agrobacterium vitis]|uniref:3-deoxy-manno-octulosonate cytidylyltransferase n=1 Tax=Agrobacterium vitis TaxID=373 RepID=A0AAE4WG67_AGRVI|nr:3-deoxy-manno-octulosonate cytidylyltransferase [Allorhizobium sp. Av2]MCM2441956.1 3-deoxy-manno-octulosonate cytidylyltransferase [Agrobacterium vitis]MUZ59759.1 3-deoxy-manno-octulosonate cytidylyltransferase [Agrobacterium vitis]MVA67034.1 3-deoxy-manno-octulosonate cytidylyltransferase [Agrobacterium vitis]MVA89096.1 3-deoxy-manno-octulosonate cytidylyltransferase [Agrobacterium vitis]